MRAVPILLAVVAVAGSACAGEGISATTSTSPMPTATAGPLPTTTTTSPALSTTVTTGTSAATTTTTISGPICAAFGEPVATGALASPELDEVSGIAASRTHAGVLWVHNDSGDAPRVWAIDPSGAALADVEVLGADAIDWEDMALGPGPGGDHLYVADIGDNEARRSEVVVYRFPEPALADGDAVAAALRVRYPGGPADAEALLVDPESGDLVIVTKRLTAPGVILRIPAAAWEEGEATAEPVGELGLGLLDLAAGPATAGDVSPDGTTVAVRAYGAVWLWRRVPGAPLGEVLRQVPCSAPAPPDSLGEAIALDAAGYWSVSEGEGAEVWRVVRR